MENTNQRKSNVNFALLVIISILMLLQFFRGCNSGKTEPKTVIVPEIKGNFNQVKPEQKAVTEIGQILSKNKKSKNDKSNDEFLQKQINQLLQENKQLNDAYANASDSLRNTLYNKAIEIKSFNHDFENDTIKITANGLVRGEIQTIGLDYKIKSRKLEIKPEKQTFLRVLVGFEIGNNKSLDNFSTKANLGFQNRKGNLLTISADTDQRFYIGYNFSILNLKK